MYYLSYIKALHVIFIVAWFSGLFFLGRIFVYHREAFEKDPAAKDVLLPLFLSAERRVWYIIIWPSLIITLVLGSILMVKTGAYREGWFHLKLLLILFFLGYHVFYARLRKQFRKEDVALSSVKLRLLNEVPFFFLIFISFTVYLRSFFSGLWAGAVLVILLVSLAFIVRFFRQFKKKN